MTTIPLIGRKNTFILGESTADYTTAVQGFKINAYAGLNLSTDYVIDRKTGKKAVHKASALKKL